MITSVRLQIPQSDWDIPGIGSLRFVHLCEPAFGRGDIELATTLVHEFSHLFGHTDDKRYCWNNCSTLDPKDAYDNADSYSAFAKEAYLSL